MKTARTLLKYGATVRRRAMELCIEEEDAEMLALLQPFWKKQQSKLQSKYLLQTCNSSSSPITGSIEEFKIESLEEYLFPLQEVPTGKQRESNAQEHAQEHGETKLEGSSHFH